MGDSVVEVRHTCACACVRENEEMAASVLFLCELVASLFELIG